MNVRKKLKRLIAMMVCAVMVLGCTMVAQAAGESGILGNGTGGIYIDINSYPYTHYAQDPNFGKWAYTEQGCAWFATSRASQITGKQFSTIYSGSNWYNNAYSYYGFSHGQEIRENALACYQNHVAVVEKIQGNQVIISEGGYVSTDAAHGYAVIRTRNLSDMGSAGVGNNLLGYVYLTNTSVPVSLTWSGDRCEPDSSNVFVYTEAHTNISGSFTEAGITIWDESGNVVASKSENPARTGMQLNIYYNVTDELGVVLKSGTNYTYQFYTVFNGTKYTTDVKSFRTKGMAENSWTQELNIADWTYGETPNTPAAAAKYGTPSFTYSNEKDGTYTAEVPQAAGTYYVKATVAAVNDQYTGLEAVKEFRINKANPEYSVPQNLTMIYSNRLESVTLPEGFSWYDSTELSGPVGERLAYAFYTPADTDNYNVVEMIEIPITVQAKDLSGMKLEGIDKNTDLDKYEIKDGDTVLVKDQDYVISSETKGDTVTVTVEFKGNYTGKTQTSYSLKTTDNNTDKDKDTGEKESDVPKTGDNSTFIMWAAMLALAGGAVVVTVRKRKFSR